MTKQKGGAIVDLGNVIIAHWLANTSAENFDTIDYNAIPEVPDAFEALKKLNERFNGNVSVVYKATDIATEKILAWLRHHSFVERTGIPLKRVHRTRFSRDKTPFLKDMTVVVDDRLEVLTHFVGKVPYLFLFRPQAAEIEAFRHTGALEHVHTVSSWKEILNALHL